MEQEEKRDKVVYLHLNPQTMEPFYVGIGSKYRPYQFKDRSEFWDSYVKKYGCIVEIVEWNLTSIESKEREVFYIELIGRRDLGKGPLVNLTSGGDGAFGRIMTKEHKEKIGLANKGKPKSEEHKEKIRLTRIGTKQEQSTVDKRKKTIKEKTKLMNCMTCKEEITVSVTRGWNTKCKNCSRIKNKI